MVRSSYYNFGILPKANREFNTSYSRLSKVGSKFSIDRFTNDKNSKSNTKKVKDNQSSINLNSSKRITNTYNFLGRNLDRNLSYENSLESFKQSAFNRYGINGNTGLKKETEKAPKVKVDKVVDLKGEEFTKLYSTITKGPLSNRVKESGIYKDKKYIVLDNTRYESTIGKSERLKTQKFQWMK